MKRRLLVSLLLSAGVLALAIGAQAQGTYKTVHSFTGAPNGGAEPEGGFLVSDGSFLYGMTTMGGAQGKGAIFKIGTDGKGMAILHSFSGIPNDGANPYGGPILDGGKLYGMTEKGGGVDLGQIFSYDLSTQTYIGLHDFKGGLTDGMNPYGSLISDGTKLYGMTFRGGQFNGGTVFSIGMNGSNFKIIHDYRGGLVSNDGWEPVNDMLLEGGTLYGVARGYALHNNGIIFSMQTDGSQFTTYHRFTGAPNDGDYPAGGLVSDGTTLYGMTAGGGSDDVGTVFSIGKDGSSYKILHAFDNTNNFQEGTMPTGSLFLDGGKLYGTAHWGGNPDPNTGMFGCGVLFSIETDGSNFTVLHSFYDTLTDGTDPRGTLISEGGVLYGITRSGGTKNFGTIFSYSLPQQLNYINLDVSPASVTGGSPVTLSWQCDFTTWNYQGVPVDIYFVAIKNPKVIDAPSSAADVLAGGEVYIAADGMANWYRYTGSIGAPTWKSIVFPPGPITGSMSLPMPSDPSFKGTWVFAMAFLYSNGTGFVRNDATPVENSNGFAIQ